MTISKSHTQITWPTAVASLSVSAGNSATSEVFSLDETTVDGAIQLKASNDGTPASGDTVAFYLLATVGDPDAEPDSADEFDTDEQGALLAVIDTAADQPAVTTVPLPTVAIKSGKVFAVNQSAGRAITVSAAIYEVQFT